MVRPDSKAVAPLPETRLTAVSRPRGWHLVLLASLAAILPALAFQRLDLHAIPPWSDYWDYLQLARQLYEGHGFSSLFTYPLFLKYSGSGEFFPLLWRPPLFPVLVAITFLFTGGPSLVAPLVLQVLGYALAVFGTHSLAREFVEARWALLAGLVTALSPHVLGIAEPGIATSLYTAGLTFGFLFAVRAGSRRRALLVGLYFGLLTLLRAETIVILPAIVWIFWAGERGDRERRIWLFLGSALLVLVPWTIRTWIVTGRPFSATSSLLFTDTPLYPGWESSRRLDTLDRSALLWALSNPGAVFGKALRNGYHYLFQALLMPLPALAPFVWGALGRLTRVGRESAYCAAVLIGVVLFMVIVSPLEYAPRLLHPFIPAVTVVGVIVLARIREDLGEGGVVTLSRRPATWAAVAVTVLAALEMIGALTAAHRKSDSAAAFPVAPEWSAVEAAVDDNEWAIGDYPSYYAWFTGDRFVWVPHLDHLGRVNDGAGHRRAIVIDTDRGVDGRDPTGIPPSPALSDSLVRRGWSAQPMGAVTLFHDSGAPP